MNLILLGAPGAGKGTQAEIICNKLSIPAISTGNIIRESMKAGTEMGKKAKAFVDEGKLVPDAVVIVDVCHDEIAVKEARKLNIPIVAIVDTNGDPEPIDYPIAANDDAVKSIKVIMDTFVETIKDAAELYGKKAAEDKAKAEAAAAERAKDEPKRRSAKGEGRDGKGGKRAFTKRPSRKPVDGAPKAEGEEKVEVTTDAEMKKKAPAKKAAPKKAEAAAEAPKAEEKPAE